MDAANVGGFLSSFLPEDDELKEALSDPFLSGYYNTSICNGFLSASLVPADDEEQNLSGKQILYKRFYEDHLTYGELFADKDGNLSDVYDAANENGLSSAAFTYHSIPDADAVEQSYTNCCPRRQSISREA